jgi:hypothetical protein
MALGYLPFGNPQSPSGCTVVTNFSLGSIRQTFNGTVLWQKVTCTISRNGDLIDRMASATSCDQRQGPLALTPGAGLTTSATPSSAGVEIEIGGQKIDKHPTAGSASGMSSRRPPAAHVSGYRT